MFRDWLQCSFTINPTIMEGVEIKESLKDWRKVLSKYQKPNVRIAIIQIFNSFIPFISISVIMYFVLEVSIFLVIPLAFLNGFFLSRIFIIQHDCGHFSFFSYLS